jgi:hypothetical protein
MPDQLPGECRYFITYTGIKLPFKLVNPLEPSQVKNRNTYFRGYFDGKGRLTALQRVIYGEVELEHRYQYHGNGALKRAEIVDADGEINPLCFDETGAPQAP